MNLIYFTDDSYKALQKHLSKNEKHYYRDKPWLENFFAQNDITDYCKTSSITVPDIELDLANESTEAKNAADLKNVTTIFSAYKDAVTPIIAANPVLWTALCHITFPNYILQRWKKDAHTVSIKKRFFATTGRSSICYYNAIARLWWSGYLTYDETAADPFHLTKILFSAQQIQKDLFDQSMSMNKTIVKGLLLALQRIQEETGETSTTTFRLCCDSYLNRYGVVSILDTLRADEIETIAYEYMHKHSKRSK